MIKDEVLKHVDDALIVDLTREMIQMQTVNPPGDEILLAQKLQQRMAALGLDARVLPFDGTRANLICRVKGSGKRSSFVMSGHMDTVPFGVAPWRYDPLSAHTEGGRIFGRGAADMKGGLAAMIAAALAVQLSSIPLEGDLVLAFTAGEETDCIGASVMIHQGLLMGVGQLLIAEPTNLDVCIAEKGAFGLEAITHGKAAHASTPHLGRNAIVPMADFIQRLSRLSLPYFRHPFLNGWTLNVGTIEGGFKSNVVPDVCRASLDFRTVPGQDHQQIRQSVEALLADAAENGQVSWELNTTTDRPSLATNAKDPFVKLCEEAASQVLGHDPVLSGVAYYTDGVVFVPALSIPMVICGPGEAALAHQTDESVKIESLCKAARIYGLIAAGLLG